MGMEEGIHRVGGWKGVIRILRVGAHPVGDILYNISNKKIYSKYLYVLW